MNIYSQQNDSTISVSKYTETDIFYKLNLHNLDSKEISQLLKVDVSYLNSIVSLEFKSNSQYKPEHLNPLIELLKNWPANQTISELTSHINQLVITWLNATRCGVNLSTIFNLLRCVELKKLFNVGKTTRFHLFLYDLVTETAQTQLKNQLEYALNFDLNTKLPHSTQLVSKLSTLAAEPDSIKLVGIFAINFQFSKHRSLYSHQSTAQLGDKIISILKDNIDSKCQLYSDGNLQFNLLLTELTNPIQMNLMGAKLSRAFEQAIFTENQSVLITPFIGCACASNTHSQSIDLYTKAGLALSNGLKNQQPFTIFSENFQDLLTAEIDRENRVIDGFQNDHLTLYFQPIVSIEENKILGAELLLRWSAESSVNEAPWLTVEILNHSGRGKLFTRWLINSACRYASQLKFEHHLSIYLTINLQAEDLYDVELPHLLMQSIALWQLSPQDIVLEITENGVLDHNEVSKSIIATLVENGFKLALDDFGTGYSSLSRLRNIPIDIIKIDQSFVRDIKKSKQDYEIVKSIALLAKSLGKEVLAEGVEDEECLALIKKMKIDKCQGYYYAKPMPYELFIDWAKAH